MRVLVANKFWYRRGGLERVMFDEITWLEEAGHEVAHFSTAHRENDASPWERYFVPYLELGVDGGLTTGQKLEAAAKMFANREARSRFARLLEDFKPDVVHIHGIHRQLSPSILFETKSRGIPVVQTLHDYHHVCPADVMLRGGTVVCEPRSCGRLCYGAAIVNRCVRGSLAASLLSAAETAFQRLRRVYERCVKRFVSPCSFLRDVMAQGGWTVPCDVIPNAIQVPEMPEASTREPSTYVLFAGRLSPEKGVDVLLEAASRVGIDVVVAGDGPSRCQLEKEYRSARFVGRVDGSTVNRLIAGATACVVPSRCYENASMSVLEAMAAGAPVVASAIGGIPEQIEAGVSGLLVPAGDVDALAAALVEIDSRPDAARAMGAAARERVREHFSPERHLELLLRCYEEAMAQ